MKSVEHTDMANGKLAEDLEERNPTNNCFNFRINISGISQYFFRRSSRLLGLIYQMFRSENRKRLPTPRIRYVLANPRTWVRQEDVNYGGTHPRGARRRYPGGSLGRVCRLCCLQLFPDTRYYLAHTSPRRDNGRNSISRGIRL